MIDPTLKYILTQHSSFIHLYGFDGFKKRKINVQKINNKLIELYGEHYNGEQFIEFGEKFLNDYLIEKHGLTFNDLLLESFQPIVHRFRHLV
jgi:hypothetical protein